MGQIEIYQAKFKFGPPIEAHGPLQKAFVGIDATTGPLSRRRGGAEPGAPRLLRSAAERTLNSRKSRFHRRFIQPSFMNGMLALWQGIPPAQSGPESRAE